MGRKRKRKEDQIELIDIADKGMSLGRLPSGEMVLLKGGIPGDTVSATLLRKKKGMWNGVVETITHPSPWSVGPRCEHFGVCGGCKWQHLAYEKQLELKQNQVANTLTRIGGVENVEDIIKPIKGCAHIYDYRNKLEFTFSNKRWLTEEEIATGSERLDRNALGFHRPGAFDKVVDIQHCHLQEYPSNAIRNYARQLALEMGMDFFDLKRQQGMLRTLMIRRTRSGQTMALFSFYEDKAHIISNFLDQIRGQFEDLDSLLYCINPKGNDSIYDLEVYTHSGTSYISEDLLGNTFKIGPKSFFQTNTEQAEVLYQAAFDMAEIGSSDVVYDLYSGIGSIGLSIAHACNRVVGIETIPEAVEDAKHNIATNGIKNATYLTGDVQDLLNSLIIEEYGRPDILITDPPRAGMTPRVVDSLIELRCPKVVYISCNPATQARDLSLLQNVYEAISIQPVDMFPHTSHIENIVLLRLKS